MSTAVPLGLLPDPYRSVRGSTGKQYYGVEWCHIWSGRHALGWGHFQIEPRVHGRLPKQATRREVRVQNFPPERVRERIDLFGHFAKPVEPYIRHRCHTDIDPVTFERPVRNRTLRIHTLVFYNGLTISWRTRNPNSPANAEAAQLWQENRREYAKRVQQVVEQSWVA